MKKLIYILVISIVLLCSGCSWLSPNYSKAITEENQYDEMVKQTELMQKTFYEEQRHNAVMETLLQQQNDILKNH